MEEDVSSLLAAASKAMGRLPDTDEPADCLILQKGAFILNEWGYGPRLDFEVYICGPFLYDLEEAYTELESISMHIYVPEVVIDKLAGSIGRGPDHLETYSALSVNTRCPESSKDDIMRWAENIIPRYSKLVEEAPLSLFRAASTPVV